MLSLAPLASLDWTALHSFDLGDVESRDGRSHPVTATTPVTLVSVPAPAPVVGPPQLPNISVPIGGTMIQIPGSGRAIQAGTAFWPKHALPRAVVIVLAIGLILLVAFRLMK